MFCARFVGPTAVSATVNKIIGPIKLIRPSGPQLVSTASESVSGTTHELLSVSKTGIKFFLWPSAHVSITPKSNSIVLNLRIDA